MPALLSQDERLEIAGEEIEEVDGLDLDVHRAGGHAVRVGAVGGQGVERGVGPKPAQGHGAHQPDRDGDEPTVLYRASHNGLLPEGFNAYQSYPDSGRIARRVFSSPASCQNVEIDL